MAFFTQDENKNVVDAVSKIMEQRVAGANLPENVREAAVEAGKACLGKSLEERRQILHHFFNSAIVLEQGQDRAFRPTNETVTQFNEVARATVEAQMAAGSFDDVASSEGSPLEGEDKARISKRKVKEDAESAGSFEDVAKSEGSPLESEDQKRLKLRKEDAESAGSFEDVAKSEGSPLESEDQKRLKLRKEGLMRQAVENLANFGDKKRKFPNDKDGDGKVDEAKGKFPDFLKKKDDEDMDEAMDTTGTEKEADEKDMKGPSVTTRATTVRKIDTVPVSDTHSFVKESWTVLVDCDSIGLGEQHILAGNLVTQDNISEACAGCPTTRPPQPFSVTVKGASEAEAIENLASALENVGSKLTSESVLVAHRTPA